MRRRNKFNAVKVRMDGYLFDSKAEARRYSDLKLMQKAGAISGLVVHPKYHIVHTGNKVCTVELDFEYSTSDGGRVFEDVKGVFTALSRLKHKLFQAYYGEPVRIVRMI